MDTVGVAEAKARLSDILRDVERGQRVVIERHGKPIAQLTPVEAPERRLFGALLGQIEYNDADLMGTDSEIEALFYGNDEG